MPSQARIQQQPGCAVSQVQQLVADQEIITTASTADVCIPSHCAMSDAGPASTAPNPTQPSHATPATLPNPAPHPTNLCTPSVQPMLPQLAQPHKCHLAHWHPCCAGHHQAWVLTQANYQNRSPAEWQAQGQPPQIIRGQHPDQSLRGMLPQRIPIILISPWPPSIFISIS